MKKALFLYTELADYNLSGFSALAEKGVEVSVVRWPVNSEAPFTFSGMNGINIFEKAEYTGTGLNSLISKISPDLIMCSGWRDKDYLRAIRKADRKIVKVLGFDNKWMGTPRQMLGSLISRLTLKWMFDYAFVPGKLQGQYAGKLGFRKEKIYTGAYSANISRFSEIFQNNLSQKKEAFPHVFLYVGRYVSYKGIKDLWEAFKLFRKENGEDWELWCVGTGDLFDQKLDAEGIRHFGFKQPSEMSEVLGNAGVYVLPSHVEPWAVAVHEMAAAGMPLLCSDQVGANERFLKEGVNGFIFPAGDVNELKKRMEIFSKMPSEKLLEMSEASHRLGLTHTPADWADAIIKMMDRKENVRN